MIHLATGIIKAFEDKIEIPDVPNAIADIESDSDEEVEDRIPDLPDDVGERENEHLDDIQNEIHIPPPDSESDGGEMAETEKEHVEEMLTSSNYIYIDISNLFIFKNGY